MRGVGRLVMDGGPGIPGAVLCGFHGVFQESWGDPRTPLPLLTITPSRVGGSLLPFRCPRCGIVSQEMACPVKREDYHDTRPGRDNYFCPECGLRYKIDLRGAPLRRSIAPGEDVGPSFVERGGVSAWQDVVGGVGPSLAAGIGDFILGILGAPRQVSAFALLGRAMGGGR